MNRPTFSYDPREQILFVSFANLVFKTERDISDAFDAVRRFWRANCGGQRVYAVIDYTNVSLDIALTEFYSNSVRQAVEEYTITTLRHTNEVHVRATLRVVSMNIHKPSNLYATKEQAIEMVRSLRSNTAKIEHTG